MLINMSRKIGKWKNPCFPRGQAVVRLLINKEVSVWKLEIPYNIIFQRRKVCTLAKKLERVMSSG